MAVNPGVNTFAPWLLSRVAIAQTHQYAAHSEIVRETARQLVTTHSTSENTIIADSERTRVLAISVDGFDDLLDQDPDFARRVLKLESRHLQQFVGSVQP
jgi:hypothetical protein